jgi:hypothetical protein
MAARPAAGEEGEEREEQATALPRGYAVSFLGVYVKSPS